MSETLVERMARAMCIAEGLDPDEDWRISEDGSFMLGVAIEPGKEQRWRTYTRKALAALRAIREPTEGMVLAAMGKDSGASYRLLGNAVWQAMIDAAIAEAGEAVKP